MLLSNNFWCILCHRQPYMLHNQNSFKSSMKRRRRPHSLHLYTHSMEIFHVRMRTTILVRFRMRRPELSTPRNSDARATIFDTLQWCGAKWELYTTAACQSFVKMSKCNNINFVRFDTRTHMWARRVPCNTREKEENKMPTQYLDCWFFSASITSNQTVKIYWPEEISNIFKWKIKYQMVNKIEN